MKSDVKNYEEQVLELGNGKMLQPGCYDENMKMICPIEKVKGRYQLRIRDKVHYIIFDKDMESVPNAFAYLFTNLEQVVLSDKTKRIENSAFGKCWHLRKIIFPEGLSFIGHQAFSFTGLTSVYLPDSINCLGIEVFSDCPHLTTFCMPKVRETIRTPFWMPPFHQFNYMFYMDRSLEKVILPEGLETIGENAFRGCSSLKNIVIPSTVTHICDNAFTGCNSLKEIEVPNGIKFVSDKAFGMQPYFKFSPIVKIDNRQMSVCDFANLSAVKKSRVLWR